MGVWTILRHRLLDEAKVRHYGHLLRSVVRPLYHQALPRSSLQGYLVYSVANLGGLGTETMCFAAENGLQMDWTTRTVMNRSFDGCN